MNLFEYRNSYLEIDTIPVIPIIESSNNDALYTFAVPTYKRAKTLNETLLSILGQTGSISFNIIISDNNNERNDETEELISGRYNGIKGLSYYKNSVNLSALNNWNRLVLLCKTKYMILIHDDDVLFKSFLVDVIKVLNEFPEAAAINVAKENWDGVSNIKTRDCKKTYRVVKNTAFTNFAFYSFQAPSGCLYNVQSLIESGGFNNKLGPSFDYLNTINMCFQKKLLLNYQKTLMLYRCVNNMSSDLDVQFQQIGFDNCMRDELGKALNLPRWYVTFVKLLKTKLRLRNMTQRSGKVVSYKNYRPGGPLFMLFYKQFEFIHNKIWVDKIHCIGEL